jgi:hypothetical protein
MVDSQSEDAPVESRDLECLIHSYTLPYAL